MKKVLLGTSAIALAGAFASPAASAEWDLSIGGYMEQQAAFATSNNDGIPGDFDGLDTKSDMEFYVSPSITLDNGLVFGAQMQFEGGAAGGVDEPFGFIRGSFGRLVIGDDDNAGNSMQYGAPDVTYFNINSGSDTTYLPFAANFITTTTYISIAGDASGLHYYTPRMAGFQIGVSYSRDGLDSTTDGQQDTSAVLHDVLGAGINYVNDFGDFNIALAGGYTEASNPGSGDPSAWSAGINVGFGGFTIGGSYADNKNNARGAEIFDVGVSYGTGPWGVSATYVHGKLTESGNMSGEPTIDKFLIGLSYDLATGVNLGAIAAYVEGDSNADDTQPEDGDGFIIGTVLRLNF